MSKNTGITKAKTTELETVDEADAQAVIIPGIKKAAAHGRQGPMTEKQRAQRGMKLEQFISLEDGDQLEGVFLGRGGDTNVNPRDGKKEKQVLPTFRVQVSATVVARILGSANLIGSLGGMAEGTHVIITRLGKDQKSNVTMFTVETGKTYDIANGFPDLSA